LTAPATSAARRAAVAVVFIVGFYASPGNRVPDGQ
jgi:hypothetical protein